ncbi:MAG: hypothetical protein M1812_004820 [Candelaria pacifica]|nr:MAG: hypothetical protein M1812_004820 [Candelaria pacifica]
MKLTAALALKSLTSKIHPPLTLSPRESQQLLSLLTSSFRRQLDHEHPSFQRGIVDDVDGKQRGRRGETSVGRRHPLEEQQASSHPKASSDLADSHIQSILTNPLFSLAPRKRRASSPNPSILNTPSGFIGFDSAQRILSDPMGWFDEQFALGTATVGMAAFCLSTHQNHLRSSPGISIAKSMKASGAGSKVLRWMTSTGLTKTAEFFSYRKLMPFLVAYLVTEERQAIVWGWLKWEPPIPSGVVHEAKGKEKTALPACLPEADFTQQKGKLLQHLVKAEFYLGGGIDAACTQFLRFVRARKAVDDGDLINNSCRSRQSSILKSASSPAGDFLISVFAWNPSANTPNQELFDTMCSSVGVWAAEPNLLFARLQAYHPTKPDPRPSLRYFKSFPLDSLPVSAEKRKYAVTQLLRTVRLLLEQGSLDDANWLMRYTEAGFAVDLELRNKKSRATVSANYPQPSKEAELSDLELLEGLELRYT